jgi:hypothetical protein
VEKSFENAVAGFEAVGNKYSNFVYNNAYLDGFKMNSENIWPINEDSTVGISRLKLAAPELRGEKPRATIPAESTSTLSRLGHLFLCHLGLFDPEELHRIKALQAKKSMSKQLEYLVHHGS